MRVLLVEAQLWATAFCRARRMSGEPRGVFTGSSFGFRCFSRGPEGYSFWQTGSGPDRRLSSRGVRHLRCGVLNRAHVPGVPGEGDRKPTTAHFGAGENRSTLKRRARIRNPDRQHRQKSRSAMAAKCGGLDVDAMAHDDSFNSWREELRPPPSSALEGPPPPGWPCRFSRIGMVELVSA